jgi:hypothetical protein
MEDRFNVEVTCESSDIIGYIGAYINSAVRRSYSPAPSSLISITTHLNPFEPCLLNLGNARSSLAAAEVRAILSISFAVLTILLGLGKVFAQSLIKRGKKVYIAGRTESNLSATAKEIGAAGYFVVDVGNTDSLPGFVEKVTKDAPEVDCLINNAGIQVGWC